jgi:hypothetical protein
VTNFLIAISPIDFTKILTALHLRDDVTFWIGITWQRLFANGSE